MLDLVLVLVLKKRELTTGLLLDVLETMLLLVLLFQFLFEEGLSQEEASCSVCAIRYGCIGSGSYFEKLSLVVLDHCLCTLLLVLLALLFRSVITEVEILSMYWGVFAVAVEREWKFK